MKSILTLGIVLINAIALSSCSSMNNLSKTKILGDDVYYTKAKAGDSFDIEPQYTQNSYTNNDDYYYYGDYESRIDRFSYSTPFDYNDDFYYDYAVNDYQAPPKTTVPESVDNAYYDDSLAYDDLGVYSAYDFGYGYFGGYDNYGYGFAYSSYIYGGGGRVSHKRYADNGTVGGVRISSTNGKGYTGSKNQLFTKTGVALGGMQVSNSSGFGRTNSSLANNSGTAITSNRRPGGSYAVYPGRPGTNATAYVNPTGNGSRVIRTDNQRQNVPQPSFNNTRSTTSFGSTSSGNSNSSSSSGSSGGSAASGGGGRPVRP